MTQFISLFQDAVAFGTVIMFGALGEILCEKSGNLNLGVPGIMYLGGIAGLISAFLYEKLGGTAAVPAVLITLISAFLLAMAGGLIYSVLTITLRANQNVTGLTLTIFGSGLANLYGGSLNKMAGGAGQISVALASSGFRANIPALANLGVIGKLFLSYGFLAYLAIVAAVLINWFLNRTSVGLNLRAVGENPATADAAGINVTRYKYAASCIGAGISGLGGLYYALDYIKGTWSTDGSIEKLGWMAVALVIFTTWKPLRATWGAYLFGALFWLFLYVPGLTRSSQEIFKMLPYLATVFVLIVVSMRSRRESQPPAHLGLPYFREER